MVPTALVCLLLFASLVSVALDRSGGAATEPAVSTPPGTAYYLDLATGDDRNAGTSTAAAWKSLERVNQTGLRPGDCVLLAGGQTFRGTLRLSNVASGTEPSPITFSSFGAGRATIDAGAADGIDLDGCAFVTIKNIDVRGSGRKTGSDGAGIRIANTQNVTIDDVSVSGFRLGGIQTDGDAATHITHVSATDNGFAGIASGNAKEHPVRDLYVGYCVADNNPGDPKNRDNHSGNGIFARGVVGGVIEYCQAANNGWDMPRKGNGPVGIWGCESDRLVIQHCISHDNKSPGNDGGGFDFDGGVTHSVMQYNLSYNNAGCGFLLCQYPGAPPWKDNIVRYNISFNDGASSTHAGIGLWMGADRFSDASVYNNTIVNSEHAVATDGDVPAVTYRNNIFVAGGDVLSGNFNHSRFENNLWRPTGKGVFHRDGNVVQATLGDWQKATGQEMIDGRSSAILADPLLAMPGKEDALPLGPAKMAQMRYFRLRDGSPARRAGVTIKDNGGFDFFGERISGDDARHSIGAQEVANGTTAPQR